jgi:Uma2 family endonuclease
MSAPPKTLSPAEYFALQRSADLASEYIDGEVIPMECSTEAHSVIVVSLVGELRSRLRGTPCSVRVAPLPVRVSPTRYLLPDVMILCGEPQFADESADAITNPKVIIEVLSPSTKDRDLGTKLRLYERLPSFGEFVAVFQSEPRVEIMRKIDDKHWTIDIVSGMDGLVRIASVGVELPMSEIYAGVTFPPLDE